MTESAGSGFAAALASLAPALQFMGAESAYQGRAGEPSLQPDELGQEGLRVDALEGPELFNSPYFVAISS
jgi:hypothetical protein